MALTQPILNAISAFDATQEHIFSFISIGGDQVMGSQLTIYDNETNVQVYQANYTSFKFEFPLAANILTNGKYYNATIATINNAGQFSEPSNPIAFYCYTTPVLNITNIPVSGTIEQSNYTFQGGYMQAEGELLNGYQYTLYNSNKEKISQSPILYDGLYQYTFSGMANDTSYYIELSGTTINNTPVSSGLMLFSIRYIQPASFAICDVVNDCKNGFIQISSNIVSIDGVSEPDPPKYIDNKEVDLTDDSSWVKWNEGFNIQNDFTMRIWGRSFNENENIVTMSNELDTDTIPNRIEMKFMATNIIDTLPNYVSSSNHIVTTTNAVNNTLQNLVIKGEDYQIGTPTPLSPSEVHFTGDIGNQINFLDTSLSYSEDTRVSVKPNNNYILLPNRIYTLNFNYEITNATTDIYYGVGFGTKDNYVGAIEINGSESVQYVTQNQGTNSITFQTPSTFEGVDTAYLWIDFAKTNITATVAVNVSKVSLYFGEYTEYQPYNQYNIPFKILGKNLFNYQKLLYFVDNNTTHENISNGYSVTPTKQNEDCYVLIGYTNNLIEGEKYNIAYQTLGNLQSFKLYAVNKGTTTIINEIDTASEIIQNNNVFVAPNNNYDLMLKFTLDSSSINNILDIWNIQILTGETPEEYSVYIENGLNMVFSDPLRKVNNIRDAILLDTVNLLNPTTLRASVKENTSYYFSNNTTNSYLLDFYNAENNLIDSEDVSNGTFTTPANCVYVSSGDFTAENVISEQLQIEEGTVFTQYFPYISSPSLVKNICAKVFTGNESGWTNPSTNLFNFNGWTENSLINATVSNLMCNKYATVPAYASDSEFLTNTTDLDYACGLHSGKNGVRIKDTRFTSLDDFKTYLQQQYINNAPLIVYYILENPIVTQLSSTYVDILSTIKTQIGTNNIMIDSQYPGYLSLEYANGYTEQETMVNYVLLKCWNKNTIPYIIHSNYITVKSPKEKIFIWTRKKNNIFDLKIENLGEE